MRKYISFLLCASLLFASCQDNEIDNLKSQIDSLENSEISSLEEQVASIFSSIESLTGMGAELQSYIDKLNQTAGSLESNIQIVTAAVETLKSELQKDMDQTKAEFLAELEAVKTTLETELANVNATIKAVQQSQAQLESKVDSLSKYVDATYAKTDWLNGTFATIDSQNAIFEEVATIKERISALNASNLEVEKDIKDKLTMRLGFMNSGYDALVAEMVTEITNSIDQTISTASQSIQEAYTKKLSDAIQSNEDSLKKWVNEKLVDYYTVASMEAKEKAFYDLVGNVKDTTSLQSQIESVLDSLATVKGTVVAEYKDVITEAITNSNAKLTAALATKIAALRTDVINPLTARVDTLESEVTKLYAKTTELKERINTIGGQINAINTSIKILGDLEKTLQEYIESVSTQLSKEDKEQYDALKAMIDQLQALANGADAGSIQSQITALKNYVGTFSGSQQTVVEWVKATLETLNNQFSNYATVNQINLIKSEIDSTVLSHTGRITDLSGAVDSLLNNSRETIDSWIDAELESYYTTDSLNVLVSALRTKMDTTIGNADAALSKKIVELDTLLSQKAAEVRTAYQTAISEAIVDYNGYVTEAIKNAIETCNADVASYQSVADSLGSQLDTLSGKIEVLGTDIAALKALSKTISDYINNSGYSTLSAVVDYLNGILSECATKYAALSDYNELYALVYGADGTGTTSGLKYETTKIQGIIDGLDKAEGDCTSIESFLDGYDFESDTLKNIIGAIDADIDALLDEVFGTATTSSIQSRIDAILTALYGSTDISATPAEGSIFDRITKIADQLIIVKFSSIQLVPTYSDGRELLMYDGSNYVGRFQFDVRPAALAKVVAASASSKMYYAEPVTKSAVVRPFDDTNCVGYDDGTLIVTAKLKSISNVPTGGSAALYVDIREEKYNQSAVCFTSSFFQFDVPEDDYKDSFYCQTPYIDFKDGVTPVSTVFVGANNSWLVESIPSWVTINLSLNTQYQHSQTITVTPTANTTGNRRSGQIVIRVPNNKYYRTIYIYQDPTVND